MQLSGLFGHLKIAEQAVPKGVGCHRQ